MQAETSARDEFRTLNLKLRLKTNENRVNILGTKMTALRLSRLHTHLDEVEEMLKIMRDAMVGRRRRTLAQAEAIYHKTHAQSIVKLVMFFRTLLKDYVDEGECPNCPSWKSELEQCRRNISKLQQELDSARARPHTRDTGVQYEGPVFVTDSVQTDGGNMELDKPLPALRKRSLELGDIPESPKRQRTADTALDDDVFEQDIAWPSHSAGEEDMLSGVDDDVWQETAGPSDSPIVDQKIAGPSETRVGQDDARHEEDPSSRAEADGQDQDEVAEGEDQSTFEHVKDRFYLAFDATAEQEACFLGQLQQFLSNKATEQAFDLVDTYCGWEAIVAGLQAKNPKKAVAASAPCFSAKGISRKPGGTGSGMTQWSCKWCKEHGHATCFFLKFAPFVVGR